MFDQNKTRLLVLNNHYDLVSQVDYVLVMAEGRIVRQGTPGEVDDFLHKQMNQLLRPHSPRFEPGSGSGAHALGKKGSHQPHPAYELLENSKESVANDQEHEDLQQRVSQPPTRRSIIFLNKNNEHER